MAFYLKKEKDMKYLMMVDAKSNHNKYYRMWKIDEKNFMVEYGREGSKGMKRTYPLSVFQEKYNEKIQKGYHDVSDLHHAVSASVHSFKDPVVRDFFESLESYSNEVLKKHYAASFENVTEEMICQAELLLSEISMEKSLMENNNFLENVFHIIPRKMKNVDDFLIHHKQEISSCLAREYDLLDVMRARATQKTSQESTDILEELDLEIEPVTDPKQLLEIKEYLKKSAPLMKRAFRVRNKKTDARFYRFMKENGYTKKDIHFLYHGSRNENWYGLVTKGPLLHPTNVIITGKAFGNGIYFAPKAEKSIKYSSLKGAYWTRGTSKQAFVAVYKVLYKNQKDVMTSYPFSLKNIAPHDAVFAHKGKTLINDEVIVFREEQVTLQYVIELQK